MWLIQSNYGIILSHLSSANTSSLVPLEDYNQQLNIKMYYRVQFVALPSCTVPIWLTRSKDTPVIGIQITLT